MISSKRRQKKTKKSHASFTHFPVKMKKTFLVHQQNWKDVMVSAFSNRGEYHSEIEATLAFSFVKPIIYLAQIIQVWSRNISSATKQQQLISQPLLRRLWYRLEKTNPTPCTRQRRPVLSFQEYKSKSLKMSLLVSLYKNIFIRMNAHFSKSTFQY